MVRTVVITRPHGPYTASDDFAARVSSLGYVVVRYSPFTIQSRQLSQSDEQEIRSALVRSNAWVAFLSPTAVRVFKDLSAILTIGSSIQFASQGAGTSSAVEECFGRRVDFESSVATAEQFAAQFLESTKGSTPAVVIPQSADGRDELGPLLQRGSCIVTRVSTYGPVDVVPSLEAQEALAQANAGGAFIVFMSPSAVRATVKSVSNREQLANLKVISIGPSTTQALSEHGLRVHAEAAEHSENGVVACLSECLKLA